MYCMRNALLQMSYPTRVVLLCELLSPLTKSDTKSKRSVQQSQRRALKKPAEWGALIHEVLIRLYERRTFHADSEYDQATLVACEQIAQSIERFAGAARRPGSGNSCFHRHSDVAEPSGRRRACTFAGPAGHRNGRLVGVALGRRPGRDRDEHERWHWCQDPLDRMCSCRTLFDRYWDWMTTRDGTLAMPMPYTSC